LLFCTDDRLDLIDLLVSGDLMTTNQKYMACSYCMYTARALSMQSNARIHDLTMPSAHNWDPDAEEKNVLVSVVQTVLLINVACFIHIFTF